MTFTNDEQSITLNDMFIPLATISRMVVLVVDSRSPVYSVHFYRIYLIFIRFIMARFGTGEHLINMALVYLGCF
jgi:hypothetical protein